MQIIISNVSSRKILARKRAYIYIIPRFKPHLGGCMYNSLYYRLSQHRIAIREAKILLTRIWHPCHACEHQAPRRLRPRLPLRERAAAPGLGVVGTGGGPDPYPRDVDYGEDRAHRGHRVDRTGLRLHRHHRPRGNPRAALHRRTVINKVYIIN